MVHIRLQIQYYTKKYFFYRDFEIFLKNTIFFNDFKLLLTIFNYPVPWLFSKIELLCNF